MSDTSHHKCLSVHAVGTKFCCYTMSGLISGPCAFWKYHYAKFSLASQPVYSLCIVVPLYGCITRLLFRLLLSRL